VLVIDDELEILRGLELRLRAAGLNVITARDGQTGLDIAEAHRPDVILLDLRMPILSGLTVLENLRRHETDQGRNPIPVVVLSASITLRAAALNLNARYFLSKPYDSNELISAVNSTLSEHRNVATF